MSPVEKLDLVMLAFRVLALVATVWILALTARVARQTKWMRATYLGEEEDTSCPVCGCFAGEHHPACDWPAAPLIETRNRSFPPQPPGKRLSSRRQNPHRGDR